MDNKMNQPILKETGGNIILTTKSNQLTSLVLQRSNSAYDIG